MNGAEQKIPYLNIIADYWDGQAEEYFQTHGEHYENHLHPSWGLWHIPEEKLQIFRDCLKTSKQILDLGCGQGHDAVAFARQGHEVIGVDISKQQLSRAQLHSKVDYIWAPAERLPLAKDSVDIVYSDHGAFDHAPADELLKEVSRVLRSEGLLAICTYTPLAYMCFDPRKKKLGPILCQDYPVDHVRCDGTNVISEMSYSGWMKLFRKHRFVVERLVELRVPPDSNCYFGELVDPSWGSRWPVDQIWLLKYQGAM